jgi:hypothetical protein
VRALARARARAAIARWFKHLRPRGAFARLSPAARTSASSIDARTRAGVERDARGVGAFESIVARARDANPPSPRRGRRATAFESIRAPASPCVAKRAPCDLDDGASNATPERACAGAAAAARRRANDRSIDR